MFDYNELDKNDLNRLEEIENDISHLNVIAELLEQSYDDFIMNKDYYLRNSFNKKISKYLLLPLSIIVPIIVGITAITTSKLLLLIILGNIISMMVISKRNIKRIDDVNKEEYENMCDAFYDVLSYNKKEIDKLVKEKENIINYYINNNTYGINSTKCDEFNMKNNYVRVRKLRKRL